MLFIQFLIASKLLYVLFILAIKLKSKYERGELKGLAVLFGWIYVAVFVILDVFYRLTWASLLFWTWPKLETTTDLLQRHYTKDTWRGKIARFYCRAIHLIDKGHCID